MFFARSSLVYLLAVPAVLSLVVLNAFAGKRLFTKITLSSANQISSLTNLISFSLLFYWSCVAPAPAELSRRQVGNLQCNLNRLKIVAALGRESNDLNSLQTAGAGYVAQSTSKKI